MYFLGDVFLDKTYKIDFELDDFIFNLEYPLSCKGIPAKNKINLCQDKSYIEETFGKLPLAVNLANNHIMDYGEEAFAKTIEYLDSKNIKYFGAGNKKNNFNNPCILDYKGKKIALFGYSCPTTHAVFGSAIANGSAMINDESILEDIKNYKNSVDMIILTFHWGDEGIHYPKATDVDKARRYIDAGSDLIIGHHAHVIQSVEEYKDKYIFYGIGNFIFPDFDLPASYDGERFQRRSSKVQQKSNNQTIIVDLNEDLDISYETAIFNGEAVLKKKIKIPKWIPDTQKKYEFYKKAWTKINMIGIFLRNPRIPSVKQVKLLFSSK